MRLVGNEQEQLDLADLVTESSVTVEIVRGERTIRMQEVLVADDLASENETLAALGRLTQAISGAL